MSTWRSLVSCLDIGTGLVFTETFNRHPLSNSLNGEIPDVAREMGADVRLLVPGRCLACLGGLAGLDEAQLELLNDSQMEPSPRPQRSWHEQRAGSLRSLNGIATQYGLRLLEDFIGGRLAGSTWLHLDVGDDGIPTIEVPPSTPPRKCPLCALIGRGDHGLGELRNVVNLLLPK